MNILEGTCAPRFRAVRELFATSLDNDELGAAIAVYVDSDLVVDLWGGFVDKEKTKPWRRDTLVNVFSTTKGLTAMCAHRLADEGRLDLDAPVASIWPEFEQAGKARVLVRDLL